MNKLDLITTRDYIEDQDKNFITSTWLRGLFFGNDWFNLIHKDTYFRFYNEVVNNILKRPGITIKIACLKDSPDVILGYAVYQGEVLHWLYTKSAWRQIGITKMVLPSIITSVTHCTKMTKTLVQKKGYKFNPFLI